MGEKRTLDFEKDPFKLVTSKALDDKIIEEAGIPLPVGPDDLQKPYDSISPQLPGDSRAHIIRQRSGSDCEKVRGRSGRRNGPAHSHAHNGVAQGLANHSAHGVRCSYHIFCPCRHIFSSDNF